MNETRTMFDFLRSRGNAFVSLVSNELMGNPAFLKAVQTAYRGSEKMNAAVEQALKAMNVPSRTEFKRLVGRVEALEREMAAAREAQAAAAPRPAPRRKTSAARKRPSGSRARKKATPAGA